jgi:hypothetical protein
VTDALDAIPVVTEDDVPHHGRERVARLRSSIGDLRTRAGARGLDFYLFVAGAVLVPLGILVIVLGWYGASNTGYLFEQIPYVLSGGFIGLGIVVVGSFAYFAYWLTRIFHQQREQADRTIEVLQRLEERLGELSFAGGAGAVAAKPTGRNGGRPFVATASGTMFHVPDCSVVANRPNLRRVKGDEPGMDACRLCDPLGAVAEA